MKRVNWSREDVIVAYALYCITPLNKINTSNNTLEQVSNLIRPSLSSVIMRMRNFIALDETNKSKGLTNTAKLDREVFEEFKNDWKTLSYLAEEYTGLSLFNSSPINGSRILSSLTDHYKVNRERYLFRASVFATYEGACAISGLTIPELLVASHIKPYKSCKNVDERIKPENGILLNSFYDKAYDTGFITVCPNFKIHVSNEINSQFDSCSINWLKAIDKSTISIPKRFRPKKEFLEYHNYVIFRG